MYVCDIHDEVGLIKYSFAVIRATFLKPPNTNQDKNNFNDFRS